MKMHKIILSVLIFVLVNGALFAQSNLTLEQAISEALSNNGNINIINNSIVIAENLAHKGQAGLLPTISASGSVDYGLDNTKLQLANSPETIETTGAESFIYNASVSGDYTLFNGFIGKNNLELLRNNVFQIDARSQDQIEQIILQVASSYYNFLRANENVELVQQSLELSESRYDYASKQKEFSGGSSLNLLSAEVDLNQDKVNLMEAELVLEEVRIVLNQLIGRPLEQAMECDTTFEINVLPAYEELLVKLKDQNAEIKELRFSEQASMLDYKITRSAYTPRLALNTSYSYSKSEQEGSFLAFNQSNGLGARLTLNIPIYSGGTKKVNEQNSKIRLENSSLLIQEQELNLERALIIAYKDYQNSVKIIELENTSIVTAERNFEYAQTKFNQGQISNTDYRQAQINLLLTKNNLNNMKFNAKIIELEVLRLTGALLN